MIPFRIKASRAVFFAVMATTLIAGVSGLFQPSRPGLFKVLDQAPKIRPDAGHDNPLVRELAAILDQRADLVFKSMDQEVGEARSRITSGSGYAGACRRFGKLASGEKKLFRHLDDTRELFARLHKRNLAAIMAGDTAQVREIMARIYYVLFFRDLTLVWLSQASPHAIHDDFCPGCDSVTCETYLGDRPENLNGDMVNVIWPDSSPDFKDANLTGFRRGANHTYRLYIKFRNMFHAHYSTPHLLFLLSLAVLYPLMTLLVLIIAKRRAAKADFSILPPDGHYRLIALHGLNMLLVAALLYKSAVHQSMTFACLLSAGIGLFCLYRSMVLFRSHRRGGR